MSDSRRTSDGDAVGSRVAQPTDRLADDAVGGGGVTAPGTATMVVGRRGPTSSPVCDEVLRLRDRRGRGPPRRARRGLTGARPERNAPGVARRQGWVPHRRLPSMAAPGSSKPATPATNPPAREPGAAPGGPPAAGAGPKSAAPSRPRPLYVALALLVGVAVTFALVVGVIKTTPKVRAGALSTVPAFTLPQVGGSARVGVPADGGAKGHPAILLFFASWCGPCRKEIPALAGLYARQHAGASPLNKVAVIGIDGNDPTKNALAFMHASGVTFPVGADVVYAVTEGKFGFSGLPESVFVDGNGAIAGIHYGALTTTQFASWEHKLLSSP
jgi:thiol-disulfide isomerase/thioredoxin